MQLRRSCPCCAAKLLRRGCTVCLLAQAVQHAMLQYVTTSVCLLCCLLLAPHRCMWQCTHLSQVCSEGDNLAVVSVLQPLEDD